MEADLFVNWDMSSQWKLRRHHTRYVSLVSMRVRDVFLTRNLGYCGIKEEIDLQQEVVCQSLEGKEAGEGRGGESSTELGSNVASTAPLYPLPPSINPSWTAAPIDTITPIGPPKTSDPRNSSSS